MPQRVALGADHAGFELKALLLDAVAQAGYDVVDLGTDGPDSVDYPTYGRAVAEAVRDGRADVGVIVCGTGIGISIAANRVPGVRAALCHDVTTARLSRQHNDANIIALGSRTTGIEVAKDCVVAFLTTPFEGGRHGRRIELLG